MLELAPYITAFTTSVAIISTLWVVRMTKRLDTLHFVFAVGVMLYTFYHYYACGILGILDPAHSIITGLFISSVAITNAYCSTCNAVDNIVNIGIDRRIPPELPVTDDRRKADSHTLFTGLSHK